MKQPLKALVLAISLSCGAIGAYANSLEPLDKE
ncbi:MBL fold metallo-hydrolase, partial [Vibrio anguillarum]